MKASLNSLHPSQLVPLADIEDNPYQPRTSYDRAELAILASSIQDKGLLQVPIARKMGNKFQLAFGHRRKKAFEILLRDKMPLCIMELTDREMFEISLTENLKRQELNPIEKAKALKRYMSEFHATSAEVAKLFGCAASTIRGMVRLLKLPAKAKRRMSAGKLSQARARALIRKPETEIKHEQQASEPSIPLRQRLVILLYGSARSDVSDDMLINRIKNMLVTNQQLERQLEEMNNRARHLARLKKHHPQSVPLR